MKNRSRSLLALSALSIAALTLSSGAHAARIGGPGHVYTTTNDAGGNAVLVFTRGAAGTLSLSQTASTGGNGTGAGLGSQGAVTLSRDGQYLFTVNAGSGTVTTFMVGKAGLQWMSTVGSGGSTPLSVTERDGIVYVLNAGVGGNVTGFRNEAGTLAPLADGVRSLSNDAMDVGPAEVSFDRLGRNVVVTEKNTSLLDTYAVHRDGTLGTIATTPSAGATPFGFVFDADNHLLASEAAASTMSSYRFPGNAPHSPTVVSAAVPTGQVAACWAAVTPDGRFAFTADAGTGAISTFGVDAAGHLALVQSAAEILAGSHPIDMVVSDSGERLFVLNSGNGTIASFAIGGQGRLHALSTVTAPVSAAGLAID
jgi:6-phosphogluconolactonase (cycloisomerase 2 family)